MSTPPVRPDLPDLPDLVVREAGEQDTEPLAALFLEAREAAYPTIPLPVHPPETVAPWLHGMRSAGAAEVWLAELSGRSGPAGLMILEDAWLHSLYVDPALLGRGIGAVLLDLAKARRPSGLGLWVFEANERAQSFYARHGFVEVRRTDGSDNEERTPDVEMAWRPR